MRKSTVKAKHQSTIQLSGLCLLGLLPFLIVGCRSPLTKDAANSGSTLSVFERPDAGYGPAESGFASTRLQPSFANARTPKSHLPGPSNSENFNDRKEDEYDLDDDTDLKGWQKQLFRKQQIAVKNRVMNTDDVANPDRIRNERASNSAPGEDGTGFTMQFSDEVGSPDIIEVVEREQDLVAVTEKRQSPAPRASSRNKSAGEAPTNQKQIANREAKNTTDKTQLKANELKQVPVQKASATEKAVLDSVKPVDFAVIDASAVDPSSSTPEEPTTHEAEDWQVHARRAIAALESEQQKTQLTPELKQSLEGALRLMNLAIGDLENALKPIEKMPSDEQQYVRNTIQALHYAFDPEGNPLASRRYALVLESGRKAQTSAATVANLEVRNVAFCTEVDRFGMVTKFPQYQFQAKQECLLYCEVDNFVAVPVKDGFETELQGSYEIVDSSGRRVADELLPLDKDFCTNLRRDYFIPYRIYMPNDIQPGKYQLKLTIEDMKGRKFGQSIVDFRIGQ
jgi:hypothetical protein